jgi:chlorophyll/bacteriochlorophyll a synthase
VAALLASWGAGNYAIAIVVLVAAQLLAMRRWIAQPRALAPWYNLTGINCYVIGMMVSAVALRGIV